MTQNSEGLQTLVSEHSESVLKQFQKDTALHSLLQVARKLGEVEGMISTQDDPIKALTDVQRDLNCLYNKLIKEAGVELPTESGSGGIGGDSG